MMNRARALTGGEVRTARMHSRASLFHWRTTLSLSEGGKLVSG